MYVSNVIADSFKIWHPGERILISAGCGTGKTSFATGPLAEHPVSKPPQSPAAQPGQQAVTARRLLQDIPKH